VPLGELMAGIYHSFRFGGLTHLEDVGAAVAALTVGAPHTEGAIVSIARRLRVKLNACILIGKKQFLDQ
jgi:hypothetical protein